MRRIFCFYSRFSKQLEAASGNDEGAMRQNTPTETDIPCPACERPMQIRVASTGVFLGCSGYALPPKERCKTTINLVSGDEGVSADDDVEGEGESRLLRMKRRCAKCGTAMDSYLVDESRKRRGRPTANLQGPIAVNFTSSMGRQLALSEGSWGVRCSFTP